MPLNHTIKTARLKWLDCACCGQETYARQWWNQDTGYGLCDRCAKMIIAKDGPEYTNQCYGRKGEHYLIDSN